MNQSQTRLRRLGIGTSITWWAREAGFGCAAVDAHVDPRVHVQLAGYSTLIRERRSWIARVDARARDIIRDPGAWFWHPIAVPGS